MYVESNYSIPESFEYVRKAIIPLKKIMEN